jgi:hypothetical protein
MADQDYYEEPGQTLPEQPAPSKMGDHTDPNADVQYGLVVDVPLCSLKFRRVTELKESFIALYNTFMIYKVIGKYEVPDNIEVPEGEWHEEKCNYRWTRARADIADVSMRYDNVEKLYAVDMAFKGVGDCTWYFLKGQDAKNLHDRLQNYFITRVDMRPIAIQALVTPPRENDNQSTT